MMKYHLKIALVLLLSPAFYTLSGQKTAAELTSGLQLKMSQIAGFHATALIKVDVDFIEIEDRLVNIKYTAPDQFDFDAKGLALMPKNGMRMEYMEMLNGANTTIAVGSETLRGVELQKLKVIPEDLESEIVLAQLWMHPETYQIYKMQTFTRKSGSYVIDFYYPDAATILANKLEVSFDIENLTAPAKMIAEFMGGSKEETEIPKEAKVIVEYQEMVVELK